MLAGCHSKYRNIMGAMKPPRLASELNSTMSVAAIGHDRSLSKEILAPLIRLTFSIMASIVIIRRKPSADSRSNLCDLICRKIIKLLSHQLTR